MDVVIVSKTHMSNAACIGGITANGRSVRLLDENGYNQPTYNDFKVRQVWRMRFRERPNPVAPHLEDVLVDSKELRGSLRDDLTMLQLVERFDVPIWRGSPDELFDNCLLWTNYGSGYISSNGQIPSQSVGFWIPDRDLTKRIFYERVRYDYPNINGWRSLPYVGFDRAIDVIPSGSLVRVSLARWWDRDGETEDRCALQLSGWYDLPQNYDDETADLPF